MNRYKCGICKLFHTPECPRETPQLIAQGLYTCNEDDEPFDEHCFKVDVEKLKGPDALIGFISSDIIERFTVKHFVKGNSSLGLHIWENGRYVEGEERLKAYVEDFGTKLGLSDKVKHHIVFEVIEKVKRKTYFELKEEPHRIAFKNYVLDWETLLCGDFERALLPIEETKEKPVFHLIPFNLNVEILKGAVEGLANGKSFQEIAEGQAHEIVEVFKSWVGEAWPLLFEIIGYCLYPEYPFNKAIMLVGEGSNGKSTFLELVKTILGEENVTGQSLQEICNYRFASCELYHKLANIYPDIPNKPIIETGRFKALTGQDTISAPRKFKTSIYFKNYAKLLFSTNELPEVADMTEAFWRRWVVIQFPNKFEDNPKFFEEHFTKEAVEKVIALSIPAFINVYVKRSFNVKEKAGEFKEFWLRSANSVYAYVKSGIEEGRIVLEREAYTPSEALYEDYRSWADGEDVDAVSKATFTKELERKFGVVKKRVREGAKLFYAYMGVRLKLEAGKTSEPKEYEVQRLI